MSMPLNEMEADLRRVEMEQRAQIEIEKIRADNSLKIERLKADAAVEKEKQQTKRANAFDRNSLLVFAGIALFLLLTIGLGLGQHIYYTYEYNKNIERCLEAGGQWDYKYQDVKPSSKNGNDVYTDRTEYCNMAYNNP